jgi:hypothetical protein
VDETRELVSLNECGAEPSANSFLPPPRMTGTVKMLIALTRSLAQCMHEFGTALRDEVRAVLLLQTLSCERRDAKRKKGSEANCTVTAKITSANRECS